MTTRFCSHCGTLHSANARFCKSCGMALDMLQKADEATVEPAQAGSTVEFDAPLPPLAGRDGVREDALAASESTRLWLPASVAPGASSQADSARAEPRWSLRFLALCGAGALLVGGASGYLVVQLLLAG